ncbi:hypothetical protein [Roseateles toxinivorans]|uniref:Uncharacterized protein n=1 Tax=Roseateles toxinivorans TaxID=270368 RepID=A0A4R6QL65_9BURK|nr:hypothetical protein [Roseateles toxinivorans]TDP62802.1 hypothetical protein DES47_10697 [Roseateles toxinivorans]
MSEPKDSPTQQWASEMEVILHQVSSEPVVAVAVDGSGGKTSEPPVTRADPDAALREAYPGALRAAEAAVLLLVHPALVKDAEKISSDFISAAKAKAGGAAWREAMALLDKVAPACEVARQEGLAYDQALLAADQAVALLAQPVVKNEALHIKTTLIEAAKTQVNVTGDRAGALGLLGQVAAACAAAKEIADRYAAALQVAEDAAAALTHPVVAPEVALLRIETIEAAKTAATAGDSGTAMTLLAQAGKRCQLAKVHTQRYVDGLALAINRFNWMYGQCKGWSDGWASEFGSLLLGVADVIPDIAANNLTAAEAKATAGEYLDAMALLEALEKRVNAVTKTKGEADAFYQKWKASDQLLKASYGTASVFPVAAPVILTRINSVKALVLDQGVATARLGNYVAASDALKPFDAQYAAVQALLVQHQDFQTQRAAAVSRIDSLSHGDVAVDKAQITTSRLTAADAKVVSGDYAEALALLAKVDGECTAIAGYGIALTAAKAAVALLTDPVVAGDRVRIQSERIDAAVALAAALDHAGATLLLGKVAAECDAAKAVVTGAGEAAAAHGAAQAPIAGVLTAPEPAFKAVEDMVAALDGLGEVIKDDREAIRATIALARAAVAKPEDGGDPKALLEQAANACLPARAVADRHGQYLLALADAELQLVALAEPLIAVDKDKIGLDRITKAREDIKPPARDYAGALAELAKVPADCAKAKAVVAQDAAYQTALTAAKLKAAALTEPLVAADKLKIDTDLIAAAQTKVTTRLYAEAMELLARVAGACDVAKKVVADEAAYRLQLAPAKANLAELNTQIGLVEALFGVWQAKRDIAAAIQLNHVDAAEALALARDFAGAVALLASGELQTATATKDTTDYYWAGGSLHYANQAIAALEAHAGVAAVAVEIAALKTRYLNGENLRAGGKYAAARQVGLEIQWACPPATKIAVLHEAYLPKLAAAKTRMLTCTGLVSGLSPAVALISDRLKDLQTRWLDAAETHAKGREYAGATQLLDAVDAQCTALETLVTDHGSYVTALAAAESELVPLTQPVVAADVERIRRDRIEAARSAAAGLDYKTALQLLGKVKAECDTAAAVAAGHAAVAKGGADAKLLLDGTAEGSAAAWLEAEKLLKGLTERHAARAAIKDRTDPIGQALAAAKALAPAEAKPKIEAVVDQCVAAQEVGDRHLEYGKALLAAEALVNGLTEPSMVTDKARITLDRIDAAKAKALLHDYRGPVGLLEPVANECAAATALAEQFTGYSDELVKAQATLDGLNALTPLDPHIGADVQKILDECITAAKTLALPATRDYAGARKLLAKVATRCKGAELKKSMLGGTDPTKGDVDAILGMDGGKQLLDDVIAHLPATTKRSVVQAAIQARFNVELKNYTKDGVLKPDTEAHPTTLKKLYQLMAMVPDVHTEGIKIDRYGGRSFEKANQDRGSLYQPGVARVVLSCGRAKDGDPHPLANSVYALPDVEPECELVPDSATSPAPKYFDWTSLHELGHAIDDKKQFMASKEGDAEFGGWRMHGRDVTPLAVAAAAKFNYPAQDYLIEYLLTKGGTPPMPDPARLDWAGCKAQAEAWCDAVRVDKQLWELGSETKKRAIGDRVYHEAYPGTWVSYDLAARSKGITGYQFRAPAEWLSELYAAHRMEKLKASHPANAWLASL